MDALERCKQLISDYIDEEFGHVEEFETPWEVGIAYCQFHSEFGDASNLEFSDEQWIVNLERNRVEMCIDGECQECYAFNDLDELADWLEENLDFDYLIGIADEWCREHEGVAK